MTIEDGTLEFLLSKEINYSVSGESKKGSLMILREPSMEYSKYYMKLKQMVIRLLKEISDGLSEDKREQASQKETQEESQEETANTVKTMLLMSERVDVGEFLGIFGKMICKKGARNICMIEGELAMNENHWKQLTPDDAFEMAVRWTTFFGKPLEMGRDE